MQRPLKLLIIGLVIIAGFVAWRLSTPGDGTVVMDLVRELPNAKERRPAPEAVSAVTATLGDETLQAIRAIHTPERPGGTRVKWDVTVPENAWFAFSLGILPEAWSIPGDGVLFRVGVSMSPEGYEELLSATMNPYANESDRRWQPLSIDLSPYAGRSIELILNTNSSSPSPPGTPGRDDKAGDLALWGAPRIIVR